MVVTCPVWWFFVDPATETGRTGRWKRRKASRSKNERLRWGEGRGEKRREEEEEERWVSSGRKNTLAGPRQRSVRSFDVCGAHSHEDVRTIFYFEYLWASTCWCPTIPPPGLPGLLGVHNQRDSAEFSTPFFPILSFPSLHVGSLSLSTKIRMIFVTQIPRIGERRGFVLLFFPSLSFVARD